MKSTVSKEKNSIPLKKYSALFGILFLGSLLFFFEHFNEEPFLTEDVAGRPQYDQERAEIGYKAPQFTLRNLENNRINLSDFAGKVMILNFWATWCAPCRVEMPAFETLYRRYRSEGLVLLAISIDKGGIETVKDFVQERKFSFPILMDSDGTVERMYPSFSIPTTYVIDRTGHIAVRVDGAKNWESKETFEAVEYLLGIRSETGLPTEEK